jgi:flagellar hook protein FlgE
MIDSIAIAETGLQGYEQALQTISNNTANMNTPGFKGATLQFSDLADGTSTTNGGGGANFGHPGLGLNTLGTSLDFAQGQFQSTGNPLDLAVNGEGYFTLQDAQGNVRYTKDGQFKFDDSGHLVSSTTGEQVMALGTNGALAPISIADQKTSPPQATTKLSFSGILSSTATSDTISNVTVIDASGTSHALTVTLTPVSGSPGQWSVTLLDGSTTVGTSTLAFNGGQPVSGSDVLSFSYKPGGGAAMPLTLDFSNNVTSFDTGSSSSLALSSHDGYGVGQLTSETFDDTGTLVLAYSNGQTVQKQQLALAQFGSQDSVVALGNNEFRAKGAQGWQLGVAGSKPFGSIASSEIEGSNVDLSREFSNLVIMQRGYQACSQVVSTASDMLTALFGMMPK